MPGAKPFEIATQASRRHLPMLRDILVTSGARFYSALLSMLALALTARWLGPEGRGVVVVVTTWVTLFATIGFLSLGQICIHRAANEKEGEWLGPAVAALAIVAAVATVLGWAVAGSLYAYGSERIFGEIPAFAIAIGFVALPFLIWEQYSSALLTIIGRLGIYNRNQVVGRTLGILIMVVAIKLLGLGIYGFLIAFVLTQAIVSSAGIFVLLRHVRGRLGGGLSAVGGLVRDGLKLHINAIGVMLYSGIDILMLQYFRGPAETGIFQLSMQLFLALLLIPQSALLVLQGRVASRSRAELWREQRVIMATVVGGMTLVGIILWIAAPWIITTLATDRFSGSVTAFRTLLFALPAASFSTLMAAQWITRGYFLRASLITLAMGLFTFAVNLLLIPRFGANGAALTLVLGFNVISLGANAALALFAQRDAKRDQGGVAAVVPVQAAPISLGP